MKKYLVAAVVAALLCVAGACIPTIPVVRSDLSAMPYAETFVPCYEDDMDYKFFAGRLFIDAVGIDVALYKDQYHKQAAVDRKDSACYFQMKNGGWIIADHNNQGFATLIDVQVGDCATIIDQDGAARHLICVEVLDGINTGHGITDRNHRIQHGRNDILMYTCLVGWQNVRICQWDWAETVDIDKVVDQTNELMDELLQQHKAQ